MEQFKVMYDNYPLYEISYEGDVRRVGKDMPLKMKTNCYGLATVLLRDKHNNRKWVSIYDLMRQYDLFDECEELLKKLFSWKNEPIN
mgnify:CR=1 FL=1